MQATRKKRTRAGIDFEEGVDAAKPGARVAPADFSLGPGDAEIDVFGGADDRRVALKKWPGEEDARTEDSDHQQNH